MHVVKKNVPIPSTLRAPLPSRRKYPFDQMDVGDSFFVPNRTKNTLATHASTVGKQLGMKFLTRLTYMVETEDGYEPCAKGTEGAVLGIGVWRVEKDAKEAPEAVEEPEAPAVTAKPKAPKKAAAKKPAKAKKAKPAPEPEPEADEAPEALDEGWDEIEAA